MKTKAVDDWFSLCVRERSDWTCEVEECRREYPEEDSNRMGLHCSHLFGRRRASVRWDPMNAVAHCFTCHQNLGENPRLFSRWIIEYLGLENADELEKRARVIVKVNNKKRAEISAHYRFEFRRMKVQRLAGVTGRIEFAGYDLLAERAA